MPCRSVRQGGEGACSDVVPAGLKASDPKAVQRRLVWMEQQVQKLEAEAAACQEMEAANKLLACRLDAAKKTRKQRQFRLRKQIAQRVIEKQKLDDEFESRPRQPSENSTPQAMKAGCCHLGEHLSNQLQNFLRAGSERGKTDAGHCHRNGASGRSQKDYSEGASRDNPSSSWPSIQNEGSLFKVASELEAVETCCLAWIRNSRVQEVVPSPMADTCSTQHLVRRLALTSQGLMGKAESAKAHVKEQELNLWREAEHLQDQFCALSKKQEPLYTTLAIELLVMKEALGRQAELIKDVETNYPAVKALKSPTEGESAKGAIDVAARLIADARDLVRLIESAADPWPTLTHRLKYGLGKTRRHVSTRRAALAAALVAVDHGMQQNPQIAKLEQQLRSSLDASRVDVRTGINTLQSVIDQSVGNKAYIAQMPEGEPAQQQILGLGDVSKHLLTLFCGSAKKANAELIRNHEANVELAQFDVEMAQFEEDLLDAFGQSESGSEDGADIEVLQALGKTNPTRRLSAIARRRKTEDDDDLKRPSQESSVARKRRATAPPRLIRDPPPPIVERRRGVRSLLPLTGYRQPARPSSAPPKLDMWVSQKAALHRRSETLMRARSIGSLRKSASMGEMEKYDSDDEEEKIAAAAVSSEACKTLTTGLALAFVRKKTQAYQSLVYDSVGEAEKIADAAGSSEACETLTSELASAFSRQVSPEACQTLTSELASAFSRQVSQEASQTLTSGLASAFVRKKTQAYESLAVSFHAEVEPQETPRTLAEPLVIFAETQESQESCQILAEGPKSDSEGETQGNPAQHLGTLAVLSGSEEAPRVLSEPASTLEIFVRPQESPRIGAEVEPQETSRTLAEPLWILAETQEFQESRQMLAEGRKSDAEGETQGNPAQHLGTWAVLDLGDGSEMLVKPHESPRMWEELLKSPSMPAEADPQEIPQMSIEPQRALRSESKSVPERTIHKADSVSNAYAQDQEATDMQWLEPVQFWPVSFSDHAVRSSAPEASERQCLDDTPWFAGGGVPPRKGSQASASQEVREVQLSRVIEAQVPTPKMIQPVVEARATIAQSQTGSERLEMQEIAKHVADSSALAAVPAVVDEHCAASLAFESPKRKDSQTETFLASLWAAHVAAEVNAEEEAALQDTKALSATPQTTHATAKANGAAAVQETEALSATSQAALYAAPAAKAEGAAAVQETEAASATSQAAFYAAPAAKADGAAAAQETKASSADAQATQHAAATPKAEGAAAAQETKASSAAAQATQYAVATPKAEGAAAVQETEASSATFLTQDAAPGAEAERASSPGADSAEAERASSKQETEALSAILQAAIDAARSASKTKSSTALYAAPSAKAEGEAAVQETKASSSTSQAAFYAARAAKAEGAAAVQETKAICDTPQVARKEHQEEAAAMKKKHKQESAGAMKPKSREKRAAVEEEKRQEQAEFETSSDEAENDQCGRRSNCVRRSMGTEMATEMQSASDAARAHSKNKVKALPKKKGTAEKVSCSPLKLVHQVKHSWQGDSSSQMSIVKGELLSVWMDSCTEVGWVYAEKHEDSPYYDAAATRAGWLPAGALDSFPSH